MREWMTMMVLVGTLAYGGGAGPEEPAVVPRPVRMTRRPGTYTLGPRTTLSVDPAFGREAAVLARAVRRDLGTATGFTFPTAPAGRRGIVFTRVRGAQTADLGKEGYRLTVTPDGIHIEAPTAAGAFYGLQTVRQLLPPAIFAKAPKQDVAWTVPCVSVTDYPRFRWRGLHVDVSRHFFGPDYIKKFIDLLALHKMNSFHWHLCDDDGWRIEIKKYPLLTQKGSSRSRTINYGKPMFYTQDEIREIVAYAADRFVNIVPEIEIPGHERAAVEAYPEWGARNDQGKLGNVFNIRDTTVQALKDILGEVTDLFPSPYIHCGGDEVWASWVWKKDPESAEKARRLGLKTPHEIQTWLMNEMSRYLASRGRRMVGWGEIAGDKLSRDTIVMAWRGTGKTGILSAKKGFDVVMAPGAYTYFDHRQAPHEKGFGGSVLTLERVYSFDPAVPSQLTPEQAAHILGCQGQLWTELIPNEARMDYMAYPRGSALAEVAWTPQADRTYSDFLSRLGPHLRRLDVLNVQYRIPGDVSITEKEGKLVLSSPLSGAVIHYTTDGSEPTAESPVYTAPLPAEGVHRLLARVVLPNGRMGPTARYIGITEPPLLADTCRIEGGMRVEALKPGRRSIGGWGNAKGRLIWRVRFRKPGRYTINGEFSNTAPAELLLTVGRQKIPFSLPTLKGWYEPVRVPIGSVRIPKPGVYTVVLSVAKKKDYKGINMWRIDFDGPQAD